MSFGGMLVSGMPTTDMNDRSVKEGVKVRVIGLESNYFGRTGKVDALVSYVSGVAGRASGPPESRGWRVIFDWPLGGLGGQAILRENELEVISSVLDNRDTSGA